MQTFYKEFNQQLESLISNSPSLITALANAAAHLYHSLPDINWAGFYLAQQDTLILGPFVGKPACVQIPFEKGVCGYAARNKTSIIVDNVHTFEGHIACDCASNSEIVIPLLFQNRLVGVLDIDSPLFNRFSETDKMGLEQTAEIIANLPQWKDFSLKSL